MTTQIVRRSSDVRAQEINLSQVITSSSSSVVLMPVVTRQGSAEPMFFTEADSFIREYGDPDPTVSMTIQSALNFFTEGNSGWFFRVLGSDHLTASLLLVSTDSTQLLRPMGLASPDTVDIDSLADAGESAIALFYLRQGPGSYGKDRSLEIVSNNVYAPTELTVTPSEEGGVLELETYAYQVAALGSNGKSLGSLEVPVTGINGGKNTLAWNPVVGAVGYEVYGRITGEAYGRIAVLGGGVTTFVDTGAVTPDTAVLPITDPLLASINEEFTVRLRAETGEVAEEWTSTLTPKVGATGVQMELEDQINPFSGYLRVRNNVSSLPSVPTISNSTAVKFTGGNSGTAPTSYDVAAALDVFKDKQLYEINMIVNAGIADPIVQLAMDSLAQRRGDCVALLDVPSTMQQFQAAVDYRNLSLNLNSSYSALFCPDLLQADLVNGRQVYAPPSGWAAALCARTDRVANPAFSPAGLNRGLLNVLKARHTYDEGMSDYLYKANVNYTRTFVGQGIALWEQQTLTAQQSALSWLSVRRIINVIKVSTQKFLMYALQEMNTEAVRRSLRNSITSYLQSVKNSSGLYDFDVVIDDRNNTAATRNAGILVVTVILIPQVPIHEIQLQVVVSKAGVSFKEALSQVTGQ